VNFTPAASTVPPLFGPGTSPTGAPCSPSQLFSSTLATISGENCLLSSTVSPT
jgi:hypothetical protein